MDIVITEMNLVARLFHFGILKYIDGSELNLYMTDLCYCCKPYEEFDRDKSYINEMIKLGQIKILSLNDIQMERAGKLLVRYKPKFVLKTISAMVIAQDKNFTMVSEDELLRETVKELGIPAYDKFWLLDHLIKDNKFLAENATLLKLVI